MKKVLKLLFGFVLFLACKQENLLPPINPDLPTIGAGNFPYVQSVSPQNRAMLTDDDPDTSGIQASVVVTFSDFMDPESFSGNVKVINTTTGDSVPSIVVSYNKEAKKLYIRSEGWSSSSAYLLRLITGGIKNRYGTVLDGDRDGIADGSPYDDYLTTFYTTGSAPDSCVPTVQPKITAISPDTQRITDPRPTITINFSTKMDTTRRTDYIANFKLFKGSPTGDPVPIDTVYCQEDRISFKLKQAGDSLINGNKYFFVITSANLKAKYPRNTPDYLFTLDADYDGPESNEPNFVWYFLYDTIEPPTVNHEPITNGRRFNFSQRMDETTLTAENIKVFDATGYVPGSLVILNRTVPNATSVEYYFEREANGPFKVFVSKNVKSKKGRLLDSNGNGIGGEDTDDYWNP
ncbi:MAG: Ig-like domain-containing protein [candidate division WOR-3 bacterium]